MIKILNLSLLVLYPIAWAAPLMRAGFLPLFSLNEISVLTGLQLIGLHQSVDTVADFAGTIGYEILTSLGARYDRVYLTA